jgi:hypothetical protein
MKRLIDFLGFHAFMLAIVGVLAGALLACGAAVRAMGLHGDTERWAWLVAGLLSLGVTYAFCRWAIQRLNRRIR